MMDVPNKVANAFEKGNPEYGYVDSYLAELRVNWRENEAGITRSSGLIVGLAVLFEFIFSNKASATTFLGIKIANPSIVLFGLGVIVAYLYYTIVLSFIESQVFSNVHDAVMKKVYPTLYSSTGVGQLTPANSLNESYDRVTDATEAGSKRRILAVISSGIRPVIIAFAPPIFIIVTYIQLFVRYGLANGMLWGSLAIAGLLFFAGCINTYLLFAIA